MSAMTGFVRVVGFAAGLAVAGLAAAEGAKPATGDRTASIAPAPAAPADAEPTVGDNAALFCRNIADAAADARYGRQVEALTALEKQLDERIAALEKKRAAYEEWARRREEFLDKADGSVVAIYSQMRPDAAAEQIAVMDPEAAAAILSKVTPRTASAILNEMDPLTAAYLTSVMAGLPALANDEGKSG